MATPAADLTQVQAYLDGEGGSWSEPVIGDALAAELGDQRAKLRIPLDDAGAEDWPPNLLEATCRRVARNLAARALPLGLHSTLVEGAATTTRITETDPEVRRLESPYRKLVIG